MSFQTVIAPTATNISMNQCYLKHTSFEWDGGGKKIRQAGELSWGSKCEPEKHRGGRRKCSQLCKGKLGVENRPPGPQIK